MYNTCLEANRNWLVSIYPLCHHCISSDMFQLSDIYSNCWKLPQYHSNQSCILRIDVENIRANIEAFPFSLRSAMHIYAATFAPLIYVFNHGHGIQDTVLRSCLITIHLYPSPQLMRSYGNYENYGCIVHAHYHFKEHFSAFQKNIVQYEYKFL